MKKFMKKLLKKTEGFTLVELIVVIAILGILAAVAVPAYNGYLKKANDAAIVTELDAIKTAAQAANASAGEITKITVTDSDTVSVEAAALATKFADDFKLFYDNGTATVSGTTATIQLTKAITNWGSNSSYEDGFVLLGAAS